MYKTAPTILCINRIPLASNHLDMSSLLANWTFEPYDICSTGFGLYYSVDGIIWLSRFSNLGMYLGIEHVTCCLR